MPSLVGDEFEIVVLTYVFSNFIIEVVRPGLCDEVVAQFHQTLIWDGRRVLFRGRVEVLQPFGG
jgi:hypothetical protein